MCRLLRPAGIAGFVAALALMDPESASAQATTSAPTKQSMGAMRWLIPQGNITGLGGNKAGVKVEWTWGIVQANGIDGPNLAGNPPPFKPNPGNGQWTGANIAGTAGQKYWVKAVLIWSDNGVLQPPNPPIRGEVTLDP